MTGPKTRARPLVPLLLVAFAACEPAAPAPPVTAKAPLGDLLSAAKQGDFASARALLESGAPVDAHDRRGTTALMLAAREGDAALVALLLERRADPKATNQDGASALLWASDDVEKLRLLLAAGADPNAATRGGSTVLMAASGCDGNEAAVKLLLEHGADATRVNATQSTALLSAAEDAAVVKLLLDHHADPRAKNPGAFTVLHAAAARGSAESAKLLLEAGADPNARDAILGRTPLHWAAQAGAKAVVDVLLAHGANPSAKEGFTGMTPLMHAAASERGDEALVKALLAVHGDAEAADRAGNTAVTWALRRGEAALARTIAAATATAKELALAKELPHEARVGDSNTSKAAIERALPLLEQAGPSFRASSGGCVSCHHQALPAMALARAKAAGFQVDEALRAAEAKLTLSSLAPLRERFLEGAGLPEMLDAPYLLVGVAASGALPDDTTAALARYLVLRQTKAGSWRISMQRPPMDTSDVTVTALAARALALYAPSTKSGVYAKRIELARRWLLSAEAKSQEELTFKALGLEWSGATATDLAGVIAQLRASQRPDGGFAQLAHLESDAYATGEAVVALVDAGKLAASDPVIQRAVRFLLADQLSDGTWFVATRSPAVQAPFESGFPHGRSQFISMAATAWAVMALAAAR